MVKFPEVLLFVAAFAPSLCTAQSHPQWWTYASPNATALVGIHWSNLRSTFLAAEVRTEFHTLGFPALPCLNDADQILISAPDLLAIAAGACPAASLRTQAADLGFKASSYRGIQIFTAPGALTDADLSVAMFADRLLFFAKPPVLRATIDRVNSSQRSYARLLSRAAVYAKEDLWVVTRRLPDTLASRFVPLDIRTLEFEGSVSLWEGLHLVSSISSTGLRVAEDLAASLQAAIDEQPDLIEGTQVTLDRTEIYVKMDLNDEQLALLKPTSTPAPAPAPVQVAQVTAAAPPPPTPKPAESPKPTGSPKPAEPPKPKLIRIYGLGDQPREVPLSK